MRLNFPLKYIVLFSMFVLLSANSVFAQTNTGILLSDVKLRVVGSYATGIYDRGAAEIVAHDPQTQRLFVVNGANSTIDVLSIANPSNPSLLFSIDVTPYGDQANSVDVYNGIIVAAVQADTKTDAGKAVFFDADGNFLKSVRVGALPDMITFTPNGRAVLVANEGEPNDTYTIDPEGSVSIIDLSGGVNNATVVNAGFSQFNNSNLDSSIRIFGPNASVAQDLEPEYITVSEDSGTAWVTLQENNALGLLDISAGNFTNLVGLGFKDHNIPGNGLDASDRDNSTINIRPWQVFGMYQPDAIASFRRGNQTYLITANEGDAREYSALTEEVRVGSLALDPTAFPNANFLKMNNNLGRLNVTRTLGNFDNDGDYYDALYAFGARSFSILTANGTKIYDSGDNIEQITAAYPAFFNASSTNNTKDDRSDNKGPEPEGVTVGEAYGRTFAFIGLERIGGILVYDLTLPDYPILVQYINNRNFMAATNSAAAGDLAPEGLHFIAQNDSPTRQPLLVVANEVSGTTTVYAFERATLLGRPLR